MELETEPKAMSEDIFDRIMGLPILNIFCPFYKKHKEGLLYLFFGGLSFLISIITYAVFSIALRVEVLIANIFAWIFSVSFAYITNRIWVFNTKAIEKETVLKEVGKFISGRIATLIVEEIILLVCISWLGFNSMIVKLMAQIAVILLNYIVSKLWVFE